jgi:hypothetical protein
VVEFVERHGNPFLWGYIQYLSWAVRRVFLIRSPLHTGKGGVLFPAALQLLFLAKLSYVKRCGNKMTGMSVYSGVEGERM